MKGRLGIQFHIAIGLLVALLAAFLINAGITTSQELPIDPQKSPTQNPMNTFEPYRTLPGGLLVKIKLYRSLPPEILAVNTLQESRLTPGFDGDGKIEILGRDAQILYSINFSTELLKGEPPLPVDELSILLILPLIDQAQRIHVITPEGETYFELKE